MAKGPWWTPTEDDPAWDLPLPKIVVLEADYSAPLPLWGDGFGNINWRFTKLSPALLDRLAAWQERFDSNCHWEHGWRSKEIERDWMAERAVLLADLREEFAGQGVEVIAPEWTDPSPATPDPPGA
jgi:hypothetical protein